VACFDCHANGHTNGPTIWWATSGRRNSGIASRRRHCGA
jgi:hypothetical protein